MEKGFARNELQDIYYFLLHTRTIVDDEGDRDLWMYQEYFFLRQVRAYTTLLYSVDKVLTRTKLTYFAPDPVQYACYVSRSSCRRWFGFYPTVDLRSVLQISHTWQMIHSSEMFVDEVAKAQVWQVIRKLLSWTRTIIVGVYTNPPRYFITLISANSYSPVRRNMLILFRCGWTSNINLRPVG